MCKGLPQFDIQRAYLAPGIGLVDFLAEKTAIPSSKGEARRMLKDGGVQVNEEKVAADFTVPA